MKLASPPSRLHPFSVSIARHRGPTFGYPTATFRLNSLLVCVAQAPHRADDRRCPKRLEIKTGLDKRVSIYIQLHRMLGPRASSDAAGKLRDTLQPTP
jgi:hypothetical protein